jgi:hypothetical protein
MKKIGPITLALLLGAALAYAATAIDNLRTKIIDFVGISAPSLSSAAQGRIYFDSGSNTFQASQNAGAFASVLLAGGTSGGIPYANSSTSYAWSGALTANVLVKGGGAGAAPVPSSITDNGTTVSSSEPFSFGALTYNGLLIQSDLTTVTTSGAVAHEITVCGATAVGAVAITLDSSPAVGTTRKLVQSNATQPCAFTKSGSQTIDTSFSTVTIAAGQAVNADEVCVALSSGTSANWHCTGAGVAS